MWHFSRSIIGLIATPVGVFVLAALDSTLFVALPFGIDAAVMVLAARSREIAWIVPLLATSGSLAGAALTFWMGIEIGDHGLERHVAPRRLQKIRNRVRTSGALMLAVLDLVPPPFPFTAVVLAAGALEVKARTFFGMLAVCRLFRFGVEAGLAVWYGPNMVRWLDSSWVRGIAMACIVLALIATVFSVIRLFNQTSLLRHREASS